MAEEDEKPIRSDDLWALIELLFPAESLNPRGRECRMLGPVRLTGILYVLRTAIPWEYLPEELTGRGGRACSRHLQD